MIKPVKISFLTLAFSFLCLTLSAQLNGIGKGKINTKKVDAVTNQFEISFRANYENLSIEVGKIWEASIPELELGTKIMKINNVDVSKFDKSELCSYWEVARNEIYNMEQVTVQINHKGTPKNIELTRKNVLEEI